MTREGRIGVVQAVAATGLFSTGAVLARWAQDLSPAEVTSLRMLLGGLFVAAAAWFFGTILTLASCRALTYKNTGGWPRRSYVQTVHNLLSRGTGAPGGMDPDPGTIPGAAAHGTWQAREEPGTRPTPTTVSKLRGSSGVRTVKG